MKVRYLVGIAILVILVGVGGVVTAWLRRPELIVVFPLPGAENLPATSPIRLVFSRPIQAESVLEHLQIEPAITGSLSWEGNTLSFIPDGSWPSGQEVNVVLDRGVKAASWLAFPMAGQSWSFTIGEANLAYLWPANGVADLYALNPETGEIQRLTSGLGIFEYTVDKEGTKLYFSASNPRGGSDLYLYNRLEAAASQDEYKPVRLLDCGAAQCRSPAVSTDGKHLAYEYLGVALEGGFIPAQVWLLNLPSLTTVPVGQESHETVQPSWSSSGWLAYYDRNSLGYEAFNPSSDARLQFPNQTGQPGSWSVDGNFYLAPEITYHQSTMSSETGTSHLLHYNIQSGKTDDLSQADAVEDVEGIYSTNGEWIAFARKFLDQAHWTLGRQIWVMNSDGSNPDPITDAPDYNHYDLAWSRDGLQLAFVRFNQAKLSDPPELWMINVDGSDPLELVIGGYAPLWIP